MTRDLTIVLIAAAYMAIRSLDDLRSGEIGWFMGGIAFLVTLTCLYLWWQRKQARPN